MVTMDGVNLDMESYGPDVKEIKGKKKKVGQRQLSET